jgi:hypothetical protein
VKTWEYSVQWSPGSGPTRKIDILMNMGAKGWELVAVYENHFYFKRELFDATVQRQESAHEGRIQLLERIADDIERQNQL